jgi:septum formation protein
VSAAAVRFVLASASPARLRTLRDAGVVPEVIVSAVDEDAVTATLPRAGTAELAQELAIAKAQAVAATLDGAALVLGCDSMVELGNRAIGKPGTAQAAREQWERLRGSTGVLHTGHCLIDTRTGCRLATAVATTVHFGELTDEEIEWYCASAEPLSVAGAFTVDGLGGWFIDGVDGDHHNVVGLSLPALRRMLQVFGYGLRDLGYPAD